VHDFLLSLCRNTDSVVVQSEKMLMAFTLFERALSLPSMISSHMAWVC